MASNESDKIAAKIAEAIDWEHHEVEDILDALGQVVTLCMTLVCAGCRKNMAKALKKRIPIMVANSARIVALNPIDPASEKHFH